MRRRLHLVWPLLFAYAACFHASGEPDGGVGGGAGGGAGGGDSGTTCISYIGVGGSQVVCAPKEPVVCAGVECAEGEQCCLTTGKCFLATSSATACPNPAGDAGCTSNADCAANQFCRPDNVALCGGNGTCSARDNCGFCEPPGAPQCEVCGCNGVTYDSVQSACMAGIPYTSPGACGLLGGGGIGPTAVLCGTANQCPLGTNCCFETGKCFDTTQPWRCPAQPDAAVLDCASSSECGGAGGGAGNTDKICAGDGCEGSPGTCIIRPSNCGGELAAVCGCDNVTYTNECWALHAGVRVQSKSACDGG